MNCFAGAGNSGSGLRHQPAMNLDPYTVGAGRESGLVGAGRGWSGLVEDVNIPDSKSVGSAGNSGVPVLWKLLSSYG